MIGERFGYLIVLRRSTAIGMLECACDGGGRYCRRISLISESDLLTGGTTSCGCLLVAAARSDHRLNAAAVGLTGGLGKKR